MASDSLDLLPEEMNIKYDDSLELTTTDDECTGQRGRRRQANMKLEEVDTNVKKIISKNKRYYIITGQHNSLNLLHYSHNEYVYFQ